MLQIKKNKTYRNLLRLGFMLLTYAGVQNSIAQSDFLSSQYMNSQLMINPAYAGVRNALSINTLVRQQWMGIEGAPTTYLLSAHTPLNKRMASVGGSVLHYEAGPVQSNELTMIYSYLIRLGDRMFVSFGLNARLYHYSLGLSTLNVIDNDPSFTNEIQSVFKPNFGVGSFLYSPKFYFGVSMPQTLSNEIKTGESDMVALKQNRSFYISSGYSIGIGKDVFLKPSFLARFRQEANNTMDINIQFLYKDLFWIGGLYRLKTAMAVLANIQVTKGIGVCYSYDFPVNNEASLGVGSHEISLTIDSHRFLRRNKDRRFIKKKKAAKYEEKRVDSIRYF